MPADMDGGGDQKGRLIPGAVSSSTLRYAGWSVLLSLFGLVLSWTFGILFLTQGGVFAPLSDLSSLLYNVPLAFVAWVLFRLYRKNAQAISGAVLAVGLIGVLRSVVSGIGLTITDIGVPTGVAGSLLAGQRIGGLITGVWLFGVSAQELRQEAFDRRVAIAGIVGGFGLILLDASLLVGGEGHPGFGLGAIIQLVGTVLWSVWIGRRLLSGRVRFPPENSPNPSASS